MINTKANQILEYIILTFLLSFICAIVIITVPFFSAGFIKFILYGIEAMSPSLAAIFIIWRRKNSGGLKEFLKNKYIENIKIKHCLLAFLSPAIVLTAAKFIENIVLHKNDFITWPSTSKFLIIAWALFAEELGWRGFLQERIEERAGMWLTPLIVGSIWALWHFHFFISGSMDVPVFAFLFACIAESYGYFVITRMAKGNVLPASIWHFSGNLFFNLYAFNPNRNNGDIVPYLISSAFYGIFVIVFLFYYKSYKKAKIIQSSVSRG